MLFRTQADWLKTATITFRYREISERSGIDYSRLQRLVRGEVELTLREAVILTRVTGVGFMSEKFIDDHLYDAPFSPRKNKGLIESMIDQRTNPDKYVTMEQVFGSKAHDNNL